MVFPLTAKPEAFELEQMKVRPLQKAVHVSELIAESSSEIEISSGLQPISPAVMLSRDGRQPPTLTIKKPKIASARQIIRNILLSEPHPISSEESVRRAARRS